MVEAWHMCIPCASSCLFFCRLSCILSFSGVFVVLSSSHMGVICDKVCERKRKAEVLLESGSDV